jgi:hypothetical protein
MHCEDKPACEPDAKHRKGMPDAPPNEIVMPNKALAKVKG